MKRVMCFGTFDLLHLGHLDYFQQAKEQGDYLMVVIARDKTKEDQKKQTVFNEDERLKLIQSLKIVNEAVLGYPGNHFKIIEDKKPDVICLGYDHQVAERDLAENLLKLRLFPKIVRAKAYQPENQKSSKIKRLILDNSNWKNEKIRNI
ncbi:MAG TPA: adenylyltransferase/cytidyltransferase family protein [Candidatus Nanoarchaeia archaeon]|nr:adenylyltransferase/cytidyltransferase family protein [Candidatus Nanoarchaeia archaeon]